MHGPRGARTKALLEHLHESADVPHPAEPAGPQFLRGRGVALLPVQFELPLQIIRQLVAEHCHVIFRSPVKYAISRPLTDSSVSASDMTKHNI